MTEDQYYEALKTLCDGKYLTMGDRLTDLLVAAEKGPIEGMNLEAVRALSNNLFQRMQKDPTVIRPSKNV